MSSKRRLSSKEFIRGRHHTPRYMHNPAYDKSPRTSTLNKKDGEKKMSFFDVIRTATSILIPFVIITYIIWEII